MKKSWLSLVALGSLAILTTGCGGEGSNPAATSTPTPSAAATPAATAPTTPAPSAAVPPTTPTPTTPVVAVSNPTIPSKPVSVDVAVGLIPPTNGESWAKTVAKGRPDPFAMLALQPTEVVEKDPITQQPLPKKVRSATKVASNSDSKIPAVKSGVDKPLPKIKVAVNPSALPDIAKAKTATVGKSQVAGKTKIAVLPPNDAAKKSAKAIAGDKPHKSAKSPVTTKVAAKGGVLRPVSPDLAPAKFPGAVAARTEQPAAKPLQAMAVEVFGTIEVDGKTQVVVKLPDENFSRYIEVGDRINGTQVLVKRVEGANSLNPIIVLEEVGVEVPRKIGDNKPTTPATAAK